MVPGVTAAAQGEPQQLCPAGLVLVTVPLPVPAFDHRQLIGVRREGRCNGDRGRQRHSASVRPRTPAAAPADEGRTDRWRGRQGDTRSRVTTRRRTSRRSQLCLRGWCLSRSRCRFPLRDRQLIRVQPTVAVTVVTAVIDTVQVLLPEQPPPPQPVKVEPTAGVAASVTFAPWSKDAPQVAPQSHIGPIRAGLCHPCPHRCRPW